MLYANYAREKLHNLTLIKETRGYPCVLLKSKGKNLKDYKIYGNSVQDGTPTPDNPVEIQSVGDKSKNLYVNEYSKYAQPMDYRICEIYAKENTIYTLSTKLKEGETALTDVIVGIATNGDRYSNFENFNITLGTDWLTPTKQITTTTNKIVLAVYSANKEIFNEIFDRYEVQLEEGTQKTSYEPYGYKIPVKISGKNLAKPLFESSFVTDYIPVKKGETYIYSESGVGTVAFFYFYETIEGTGTYTYVDKDNSWTATKDGYVRISKSTSSKFEIMLEKNTVVTEYEPYIEPITTNIYLDEPLRKIGDYTDYIDFENKNVVRKIKEYTITGTENWRVLSSDYPNIFYITNVLDTIYNENILILSNHYVGRTSGIGSSGENGNIWIQSVPTYPRLYIYDENYNNNTDFKQSLVDKYNTDNPVKIYYPLAEELPETIKLPNIATHKATTIIETITNISPSDIWVKYISK